MDKFIRTSQRQSASQASGSGSSKGKEPLFIPYHSAASKTLARALAATPSSDEDVTLIPSPSPSFIHELPADGSTTTGIVFEIDWGNIWLNDKRLPSVRLGYKVRHKSQIRGGKPVSWVWKYGAELEYSNESGELIKIWLCKVCHLQKLRTAARKCNAYHHIEKHLKSAHRVSWEGLIPDLPRIPSDPFELAAAVAGAQRAFSHKPYEEEDLQGAMVDWVISKDISFLCAASSATRALITWNRAELLGALPGNYNTIGTYIVKSLESRKTEIRVLLETARSKMAISADVWSSPNHLSFVAVVAHFVG